MYYTTLEYYLNLFENSEREYAFKATTVEEFKQWKEALRARLADISGINRCIPVEAEAKLVRREKAAGFEAEYYTLETEPGVVMPFYLIRPEANVPAPDSNVAEQEPVGMNDECALRHPVMMIPHGHGGGKEAVLSYQKDFIRDCLADGFIVACPDERGSGERREFPEQGEEEGRVRANSHRELMQIGINFGRTVIGTAVWDLMKLADWLLGLPEAGDFLACAGMSGGGQQALWFGAMDERVSATITSGYFYGVKESLLELPQNCACNFVPHFFETADMGELGAMIAPGYLFVESGEKDGLCGKSGIDNVYPQVETAKRAFELLRAGKHLKHSVHPGGHQWVGTGMREFLQVAMQESSVLR